MDYDLPMIWKAAQYTATTEPDFKGTVWFLELNDRTLAYSLVLQYKEAAFCVKTSYDNRYKTFFPGIYVNNAVVRELFNKGQLRNIDFLTDLPFHRNWTSTCLPRVRIMMTRKGISSIMMRTRVELEEFLRMKSPLQLKQMAGFLRRK